MIQKPARQSNFELLRLVSMLMVMMCHAIGYINQEDLVGTSGFVRLAISQLMLVCVNVFIMISGWFGINASWKGVATLLFQMVFLAGLCCGVFYLLGLPVSFKKDVLPYLLLGKGYWFVVSYLILYAMSPVLNAFAGNASRQLFRNTLVMIFAAEFGYGFLLDTGHYQYGFSPLAYVSIYLLARYARLYPGKLFSCNKWADLTVWFVISLVSAVLFWFGYKWLGMGFHLNHYDSPLAIAASLYFLLFFSKLEIKSSFINWCASSAFAIYLIHVNSLVLPYYRRFFGFLLENTSTAVWYMLMPCIAILIGFLCILIDKFRLFVWRRVAPLVFSSNQ